MSEELVAKLEGASEGSKDLGVELLLHFGWHRGLVGHFYGPLYQWSAPDRKPCLISGDEDRLPNPTTSLDAALALAERVLPPGYTIRADIGPSGSEISIDPPWKSLDGPVRYHLGSAPGPALALCIAILRAACSEKED